MVVRCQLSSSVFERGRCGINDSILKAIIKIHEKERKRPCKETIYRYFVKSGVTHNISEVESGIQHLVMEGLIENQGEPGKDSLFIIDGGEKIQE